MMKTSLASAAVALSMSALAFAACQSETVPLSDEPPSGELGDFPGRTFCGGIAGFPCPEGLACADDPSDDCDPANGGADCSGLCVDDGLPCTVPGRKYVSTDVGVCARIRFTCDPGLVAFSNECGCGCEPSPREGRCGDNRCNPDEFCCNYSCGICAPKGGTCILTACD